MSLTVSSAPAVEPVTSAETKLYLRIDSGDTSQDTILTLLITAAREAVEAYLGRALITRTYTWVLTSDEARTPIWLRMPPVASITSVTTYDDTSGSEVASVVASTNYQLVEGLKLVQRNDGWTVSRKERAMQIVYTAGYGAAASAIPQPIKLAILRTIATQFEVREDTIIDASVASVPTGALSLLEPYRYAYL